MSDPGKYRSRNEIEEMRKNGPIKVLQNLILENGYTENDLKEIDKNIRSIVNDAADFAINSDLPNDNELFKDIIID